MSVIADSVIKPSRVIGQQQTTVADRERVKNKRLAQLHSTNITLDPSSTSHRCVVLHPGLSPQAVDDFGNISLVDLVTIPRTARLIAMYTPCGDGRCFMDFEKLREGRLTFVASVQYDISSYAYDMNEKKFPLHMVLEVGHVGRTSFSIVTTITLPSGHVLLTAVNQAILIDPVTRRPTPLPEHWRQYYGPLSVRQQPCIIRKQSSPCDDSNTDTSISDQLYHQRTVMWSDTDHNEHANFTSYIRFAMDALHSVLRKGTLDGCLTIDDVKSGVSDLRVAYIGESFEGDVLHLRLWCPASGERTAVCDMEKAGGQSVCQVTEILSG